MWLAKTIAQGSFREYETEHLRLYWLSRNDIEFDNHSPTTLPSKAVVRGSAQLVTSIPSNSYDLLGL